MIYTLRATRRIDGHLYEILYDMDAGTYRCNTWKQEWMDPAPTHIRTLEDFKTWWEKAGHDIEVVDRPRHRRNV